MDWKPILTAALTVGGMGLIFGALLAIVSRIFHVEEDPRKAQVRDCLPGANCGGCGYAGCDAYAQEIVSGNAPVNKCPVAGDAAAESHCAAIMGRGSRKARKAHCHRALPRQPGSLRPALCLRRPQGL